MSNRFAEKCVKFPNYQADYHVNLPTNEFLYDSSIVVLVATSRKQYFSFKNLFKNKKIIKS